MFGNNRLLMKVTSAIQTRQYKTYFHISKEKKTVVTNCFRLHSFTEKLAHNPLNHPVMA